MFSSIRARVFLGLSVLLILVLSLLSYFLSNERQDHLQKTMADLQSRAEEIAEAQNDVIEYAREMVFALTQLRDLAEFSASAKCPDLLAHILQRDSRLSNVLIAAPNGDAICNSTPTAHTSNIADRAYFQAALKKDFVIGEPIVLRSTGNWSLPVAKALRDSSGQAAVVLVVSIDLQWVNGELAKSSGAEGARLGLINSQGVVLARYPDPEHWVGRSATHTPFFADLMAQRGSGAVESTGFDGVRRVFGFARFADTLAGPIYLWIGVSREAVLDPVNDRFIKVAGITLTLLLLLFAAVWIVSDRLLLRPLSIVANTARQLGKGDHNARTGLRYTEDEIGQLARIIDQMAVALTSNNEILRLNRALKMLSRCNKVLVHAVHEAELLTEVCRIIVETGSYRMAWVGYAEADAEKSVRPVAQWGYEQGYLERARISWGDNERGRGPTGTAIRTGSAQINQDFFSNPALAPWREDATMRGYRSSTALPLKNESGVFGALTIYSPEPAVFSAEEIRLLEELAAELAFGIVTLRTSTAHHDAEARLHRSMESTIEAIAATLEMRDPYTAGHQHQVAELAVAIARELGLPEDEVHGIRLAATVHDIGKIRVPTEVLTKPTRLNEIEYRLIQQHVQGGYDILKGIDFPWPIAELVYQHHERIDGSGYPRALKGDEMLLGAKIMAVADTVDAMASDRPYRAAVGIHAALQEITENRGRLYAAEAVDACVALFKEKGYKLGA